MTTDRQQQAEIIRPASPAAPAGPPPLPAGWLATDHPYPPDPAAVQQQQVQQAPPAPRPARPAGPPTIEVGGETFPLARFGPYEFQQCQEHVARLKRKEFLSRVAELHGSLPADTWQREWDRAKKEVDQITPTTITVDAIKAWLDTRVGVSYSLWLMVEKARWQGMHLRRFSLEEVEDHVRRATDESWERILAERDATVPEQQAEQPDPTGTPPASTPPDSVRPATPTPAPRPPVRRPPASPPEPRPIASPATDDPWTLTD